MTTIESTTQSKSMFKSGYNKGFQMTFKNGITISVQWGYGNYCSRKSFRKTALHDMENKVNESPDAEIMIWDADDKEFNFVYDGVKGYVDADEVAHWIYLTMSAINLDHIAHMARMHELLPPLDTTEFVIPSTYKPSEK